MVVRLHTAGPNDVNVDNTMLASQFATQRELGHGFSMQCIIDKQNRTC